MIMEIHFNPVVSGLATTHLDGTKHSHKANGSFILRWVPFTL